MGILKPIRDNVLCTDADFGDQVTEAGLIIKSNIEKSQGITSRWFKLLDVGPDCWKELKEGVEQGKWVLVEYGRWTEGLEIEDDRLPDGKGTVWRVEMKSCLAVADSKPNDIYYNTEVVTAERKERV